MANSAWANRGQVFETAVNAETARKLSGTDFTVDKAPLYDARGNKLDGAFGIFKNGEDFLGAVGNRYQIIQNADLTDVADALLANANGSHYDSAGYLKGGRTVYYNLSLPQAGFEVVEGDKHSTYLTVKGSHDGSGSVVVSLTDVRIVCYNTLRVALKRAGEQIKIRHTRTAVERMEMAKKVVIEGIKNAEAVREQMRFLAQKKVTREGLETIISRLFPVDKKTGILHTKSQNAIGDLLGYYEGNDKNAFPQIRGTAYNLFNAVTEYVDKARSARGQDDLDQARAESALFGSGAELKEDALEIIMQVAQGLPNQTITTYKTVPVTAVNPKAGNHAINSLLDMVSL